MARPAAKSRGTVKPAPVRKQAVAKAAKASKKAAPVKRATKGVKKVAAPAKKTTKAKKAAKPATNSTKSVKKAAKTAKLVQVPEADIEEPQCSVCMDDLSSKRSLQFLPCEHSFHRTCAIEWLETRDRKKDQVCPLCRQKVENIKENKKTLENRHLAQGGKQPCADDIGWLRRQCGAQGSTEDFVEWLKTKCRKEITAIRAQRKTAVRKGLGADYIEDIDKELAKLTERVKIFNETDVESDDEDDFFRSMPPIRISGPFLLPMGPFPLMRGPFRPMGVMGLYRSVPRVIFSPESDSLSGFDVESESASEQLDDESEDAEADRRLSN